MFLPLKDHNPTVRTPVVTMTLLAMNVVVFLVEILYPNMGEFIGRWGATPFELTTGEDFIGPVPNSELVHPSGPPLLAITAVTSMFLHGGPMHLGFNMLYLWIFGNNVEDAMGRVRFTLFYLVAGLLGLFAHVLTDPDSLIPTVGASGAISGLLGAYLILYPRARVTTLVFLFLFITTFQVRAVYLLGFWMIMQVFSGISDMGSEGGVAYWAHIGGFVAGMLVARVLVPKDSPWHSDRHVYAAEPRPSIWRS